MSVDASYFDTLYNADPDPWKVGSLWYEQRKRALLLAALPRREYRHTFEPACGTGDLTLALAERSTGVVAWDCSEAAVSLARDRLSQNSHVQVERRSVPHEWPAESAGKFDLIVISELAYYLSAAELTALATHCANSLEAGGELVACHWRHGFHDRLQSTRAAHQAFHSQISINPILHHQETDFLLEVWRKQTRSGMEGVA